jgi:phage internal scaffolding protein
MSTKSTKFKTAYGDRERVITKIEGDSLTHQSFQRECDINGILAKYQKTGLLTHVNDLSATFGDFSEVSDYHTSMNAILSAQDSFLQLPSSIRKRFNNDPAAFMEFVNDPKNKDSLVEMGLAEALTKTEGSSGTPKDPEEEPSSEPTE